MRWYIVVEGRQTEKRIYQAWISHAFPDSGRAERIEDVTEGRYFLIAGNGYPSYLQRIGNAVKDIQDAPDRFDHLWICIDAEELPAGELRGLIDAVVAEKRCPVDHSVVIQDCCMETWLLGNRKFAKRNPQSEKLRSYYEHYDVRKDDPENLPAMSSTGRAAFHLDYLREMFCERNETYSKSRPGAACDESYLRELVNRVDETGHLQSLRFLIERWREFGGQPGKRQSRV